MASGNCEVDAVRVQMSCSLSVGRMGFWPMLRMFPMFKFRLRSLKSLLWLLSAAVLAQMGIIQSVFMAEG